MPLQHVAGLDPSGDVHDGLMGQWPGHLVPTSKHKKSRNGKISNTECQKMVPPAQPSFARKMFPVLLRAAVPILSPSILLQNSLAAIFYTTLCVCVFLCVCLCGKE